MLKFAHLIEKETEFEQSKIEVEKQENQEKQQNNNEKPQDNQGNVDDEILQVEQSAKDKDYISRYYSKYFREYRNDKNENLDQYAFQHVNRLTLIGLSENHVIRKNKLKIKKVSYECIFIGDLKDFTKGKKKQGSVQIEHNKKVAEIHCENGEIYPVYGVLKGHIIELNENLLTNPNWIVENGNDLGHIAVCDMHRKMISQFKTQEVFLNEEQYQEKINNNSNNQTIEQETKE